MGGASARFMWDLLAERKRSEELEDRYSIMLRELQAQAEGDFIIGQNPKMKEVAQLIVRVAATPTTVLILGESGTGKELVARAIHRYSNLRDKPLITVNCTALAPTLLESELFGHKRGAFTGAVADKPGLFEKADGGTIFLDEVGDMAPEMQSRLLRVLQTGESKPVGDVVTLKVRVRVIAATNRCRRRARLVRTLELRPWAGHRVRSGDEADPPQAAAGLQLLLVVPLAQGPQPADVPRAGRARLQVHLHHALRRPCRHVLGVERHARAHEERGAGPVDARADQGRPPDRESPRHGQGCPFPGAGAALHSRHGRATQRLGRLQ